MATSSIGSFGYSHCSILWVPAAQLSGGFLPIIVLPDGQVSSTAVEYALSLIKQKATSTIHAELRAVALMFDFGAALFPDGEVPERDQERFFHQFLAAIDNGTVSPDGTDPTGLRWSPRTAVLARRIVGRCTDFLEFAARQPDVVGLRGFRWAVEQVRVAAQQRTNGFATYSLLAHLRKRFRSGYLGFLHSGGARSSIRPATGFPAEKIGPLIAETLHNRRATHAARVRDALAWVLMAYGGIRSSELFHIWVNDISMANGTARVFLRHPSDFAIKVGGRRQIRRMQLLERYGSLPRHLLPPGDRLRAGWKGISCDYDCSALVHWIDPRAGELFSALHRLWLTKLRPSAPDHPYYFACVDRDGDFGGPWTLAAMRDAFKSACARIDLSPDQSRGICPHGLRHAYGLAAEALKLPNSVIQEMMHHRHPLSQEAYKKKRSDQVSGLIADAHRKIAAGELILPPCDSQYWDSDPRRLFDGWRFG